MEEVVDRIVICFERACLDAANDDQMREAEEGVWQEGRGEFESVMTGRLVSLCRQNK